MIVKKVRASQAKSKAAHIRDLTEYILDPTRKNTNERVLYSGGTGFLSEKPQAQQLEMIALASQCVRSKNPISHYVLSWREGEQPSGAQVKQAVAVFLEELGLKGHQAIYGLHSDTDNIHLHIAVNRVHPETEKAVKPSNGFDIEAGHRAVARIEHLQGWQPEDNGRYVVLANGELARAGRHREQRGPSQKARDMEVRTGEKSAERIASEEGAGLIRGARSWTELHRQLAERGMRLEKKGSGAVLWVGQTAVKASSAGRDCSLVALQKRLGPYEACREAVADPRARSAEPLTQGQSSSWRGYITARKAHYAAKDREWKAQRAQHERERKALGENQRGERERLLQGHDWRGRGEVLNAMRSVLAAQQAGEKAELKDRQQREREGLRGRFPRFLDYEEWLRQEHGARQAERWRYREGGEDNRIEGPRFVQPEPRDIRSFVGEAHGGQVHYRRSEGAEDGRVAFVDKGRRISIFDAEDRDSVLAALQLSAQKWGEFEVRGSEGFKRLCVELAAEQGFRIVNPELEEAIAQERQRRQKGAPAKQQERQQQGASAMSPPAAGQQGKGLGLGEVYRRHYQDIRERHEGERLDLSRVDAMIAVRMRATGHSEEEVVSTLAEWAQRTRNPPEARDWQRYAERTARYAFGVGGDKQLEQVGRYRGQWLELEGRGRQEERQTEKERLDSRAWELIREWQGKEPSQKPELPEKGRESAQQERGGRGR